MKNYMFSLDEICSEIINNLEKREKSNFVREAIIDKWNKENSIKVRKQKVEKLEKELQEEKIKIEEEEQFKANKIKNIFKSLADHQKNTLKNMKIIVKRNPQYLEGNRQRLDKLFKINLTEEEFIELLECVTIK